jgi:hypothetical protein
MAAVGGRNFRSPDQWASTLDTYASPVFGALPVQAIDIGLVMKALEPIWSTKPERASRVRGRIEAVLDWTRGSSMVQGVEPKRTSAASRPAAPCSTTATANGDCQCGRRPKSFLWANGAFAPAPSI